MAGEMANGVFEREVGLAECEDTIAAHIALREALMPDAQAWVHRSKGMIASAAEIACATSNSVHVHGDAADRQRLAALIAEFLQRGRPFTVSIRGSLMQRYAPIARAAGLSHLTDLPMMTVRPDGFRPVGCPAELRLRLLAPDDPAIHLDLVAEGLELSREGLARIMSPPNRASPAWSTYVGEVEGELAVTGTAIVSPQGAGLICIATDPRFGRRGFGSALTSAAIVDAFARGAPRIFLHSSPQGFAVYRRLGFRIVEQLGIFGPG